MIARRLWQEMTTDEAARIAETDPVVVLPVAAIEQHGPHLPLSTDLDIGMGLLSEALERLPADFPVWTLPPQAVGSSPEHLGFAGTLSLPPELLGETMFQIGSALATVGVRRLVVHNSHGGNRAVVDLAALRLRREHALLVVKATYPRFSRPADVHLPEGEWRHGIHGGAVETAMMLHLRPDLVRMDAAACFPSLGSTLEAAGGRVAPEGEAPFAWLAGDLGPTGAVGDARLADAETGRRLVAHYAAVLAEVIADARAFPLTSLY